MSGAYRAIHDWAHQRSYPGRDIPDRASFAAFEQAKSLARVDSTGTETDEPWRPIGPHNIGGRTLAVAISPHDPDVIYAGSASGGLWRSDTAGVGSSAWQYVPTGFPVLAVSTIALDPVDPDTIYIGTGEVYNTDAELFGEAYRSMRGSYGIGILKSTDRGATWAKSLDWSANQRRGVQALKIDQTDPDVLWAATTVGVLQSPDAGATWVTRLDVPMATDVIVDPVQSDTIIAACGNFSFPDRDLRGIYRSADGGQTWSRRWQENPTFRGKILLAASLAAPGELFASVGSGFNGDSWDYTRLLKSSDGGHSWQVVSQVNYAFYQGWFSHDVAVNPSDPDELFAVGIDVWRSRNGGDTLQQISFWEPYQGQVEPGGPEGPPYYVHSDVHDVIYHPTDHRVVYLATDGGVFRTTNGGASFQGCNGGYQTTQFYNGFSSSTTDPDFAIGGLQDNNSIIYLGSTTWSRYHIGGDGSWTAIDPRDANNDTLYGSAQYLRIFKSTDGSGSWSDVTPGDPFEPTSFIAPFALSPADPDVIYAGRAIVYKSVNGGDSWFATNGGFPLDGNPSLVLATSSQSPDVAYVATAPAIGRGGLFRTIDGGASWQDITHDLPDRFPGDLAVDPQDDETVYVTFSGFGSSHVFRSHDGGDTWTDIGQGLPDVPTTAIVVDPFFRGHLYVGNDIGVYASRDDGNSWLDFSVESRDAVAAFELSISADRQLRVATHGNGVFERPLPAAVSPVRRGSTRVP